LGASANKLSFVLFLSVAASITAISVVARALEDLGMARTKNSGLALSSCAVNDLFGWLLFTVVISLATGAKVTSSQLAINFFATLGFVAVCIALGPPIVNFAARMVRKTSLQDEMALQTLIVSVGLLCGAITQWLGIHAILGFFLAGSAPGVGDEMQNSFSTTAHAIFVPLFFASIGLNIDFVTGLEFGITVLFTLVAVGGKFIGAWVGALALELKIIDQRVFVAIVFAALASSVVTGPLVGWLARRMNLRVPLVSLRSY
jgi:Kef-type K+ transport system membrane component KefB